MVKEIDKKTVELGILDSRLQELEQALALMDRQIAEFQLCQLSLDEIEKLKKSSEMLAPIGAGIFVKTALADNSEVFVDVGAKVVCKKNLQEAKQIIEKKVEQAMALKSKLAAEAQFLAQSILQIEQQLKKAEKKVDS